MIYIYPKFSKTELFGVRFKGAGLGNLLFIWSRAIVAAEEHNCKLIWPTWPSIKLGPWIRREKDKRFYGNLFKCKSYKIYGIKKYIYLIFKKKYYCKNFDEVKWEDIHDGSVLICNGYNLKPGELQMNFNGLREYRSIILNHIISNLKRLGQSANNFKAENSINVHVRLGDFTNNSALLDSGANNTRISIEWYVYIVNLIRSICGFDIPVNVFSDGKDEELEPLLKLDNTKRVFFGNSIADIIALSKAPLIISSGSSFSLWGRFLGQSSSFSYPHQMKDRVLCNVKDGFEVELGINDFPDDKVAETIREMYPRNNVKRY